MGRLFTRYKYLEVRTTVKDQMSDKPYVRYQCSPLGHCSYTQLYMSLYIEYVFNPPLWIKYVLYFISLYCCPLLPLFPWVTLPGLLVRWIVHIFAPFHRVRLFVHCHYICSFWEWIVTMHIYGHKVKIPIEFPNNSHIYFIKPHSLCSPVPVAAQAQMSLPNNPTGMQAFWIGVGWLKLREEIACNRRR